MEKNKTQINEDDNLSSHLTENEKSKYGAIYTPKEIVQFMLKSVNLLLQKHFSRDLFHPKISIFDPASGTMAYAHGLISQAYQNLDKQEFVEWFLQVFCKNFYAFEIMEKAWKLGKQRILQQVMHLGIKASGIPFVQTYNFDALKNPEQKNLFSFLSDKNSPIEIINQLYKHPLVVITNPPYNVKSLNTSPWIESLTNEYTSDTNMEREPDKPHRKKITNTKSVKDDYIKFIRFAQYLQEKNAQNGGIVAYITNNYFIDGLTTRGVRKSLRKTFDEIWILNLYGDWRKTRLKTTEKKDENVFEVTCGIAISFFVRYGVKRHKLHKKENPYQCKVKYSEILGTKTEKLAFLEKNTIKTINFFDGDNDLHDWEFLPSKQNQKGKKNYHDFIYLCDCFNLFSSGYITFHDSLVIDCNKAQLEQKMKLLFENVTEEQIQTNLRRYDATYSNKPWWSFEKTKQISLETALSSIIRTSYRGFDRRWIAYHPALVGSTRIDILNDTMKNKDVLIASRDSRKNSKNSVFMSNLVPVSNCIDGGSSTGDYCFPLFVNSKFNLNKDLFHYLPYFDGDFYESFTYVCDLFDQYLSGIKTGNDPLMTDVDINILKTKIKILFANKNEGDIQNDLAKLDVSYENNEWWDLKKITSKTNVENALKNIQTMSYRGFDKRYIVYDIKLLQGHLFFLSQYLLPKQKNIALTMTRRSRDQKGVKTFGFVSKMLCNQNCLEKSGADTYIFPLRINTSNLMENSNKPKPAINYNIKSEILEKIPYWNTKINNGFSNNHLMDHLKKEECVFYYIYGVLYSSIYQEKYHAFLVKDFPRIPFCNSKKLFYSMSTLGKELAEYHTLIHPKVQNIDFKTNQKEINHLKIGSNFGWLEENICFEITEGKPHSEYLKIQNVSKEIWEFKIGNIQQLKQWLKARRFHETPKKNHLTRSLTKEELIEFFKIINAIKYTLEIVPKIDNLYLRIEEDLLILNTLQSVHNLDRYLVSNQKN